MVVKVSNSSRPWFKGGEQATLGGLVSPHVAVIVQVFPSQVGEDRRVELKAPMTLLHQGVRTKLQHQTVAPQIPVLGRDTGQLRRTGGGVTGGQHDALGQAVAHGPHNPRLHSVLPQNMRQDMSRGGLTVGPGDTDDLHVLSGLTLEQMAGLPQGPGGFGVNPLEGSLLWINSTFAQDRHRSVTPCVADKPLSVGLATSQGREKVTRAH